MQSVTIRNLDSYFRELLKRVPETRREMFEGLANELLKEVHTRIGGAGKVQSWQEKYVGSGGGYAAVRPQAKKFVEYKNGKKYAWGYVTNAIENGHVYGKGRVAGKHFYAEAYGQAEMLARNAIEQFEQRIKEELE